MINETVSYYLLIIRIGFGKPELIDDGFRKDGTSSVVDATVHVATHARKHVFNQKVV